MKTVKDAWYVACPACDKWLGISGWMSLELESHCVPNTLPWAKGRPCGHVVHTCGAVLDLHTRVWFLDDRAGRIPYATQTCGEAMPERWE